MIEKPREALILGYGKPVGKSKGSHMELSFINESRRDLFVHDPLAGSWLCHGNEGTNAERVELCISVVAREKDYFMAIKGEDDKFEFDHKTTMNVNNARYQYSSVKLNTSEMQDEVLYHIPVIGLYVAMLNPVHSDTSIRAMQEQVGNLNVFDNTLPDVQIKLRYYKGTETPEWVDEDKEESEKVKHEIVMPEEPPVEEGMARINGINIPVGKKEDEKQYTTRIDISTPSMKTTSATTVFSSQRLAYVGIGENVENVVERTTGVGVGCAIGVNTNGVVNTMELAKEREKQAMLEAIKATSDQINLVSLIGRLEEAKLKASQPSDVNKDDVVKMLRMVKDLTRVL